jgi:hypothetical protein
VTELRLIGFSQSTIVGDSFLPHHRGLSLYHGLILTGPKSGIVTSNA